MQREARVTVRYPRFSSRTATQVFCDFEQLAQLSELLIIFEKEVSFYPLAL